MTKKEEKKLDEKIDEMVEEMEKDMAEREKEMEREDRDTNQILRKMLLDFDTHTPFCHFAKPDGVAGKEFMVENMLLRHCVGCGDEEQCWSVGQLKDLIKEERKTLLNQDY